MAEAEKTAGELRREALLRRPKNGYDRLSMQDEIAMHSYCEDYKKFLKGGCSTVPVSLLKLAGADLTTEAPFKAAMEEFRSTLEQFRKLS